MTRADDAFDDWKRRADQCDLLATAIIFGAKLKRAGREHVGPCIACAGADRFSINPGKNLWNCRGHGGGHGAVGMVMHATGMSFLQTCEALTGEQNPSTNRPARHLSPEEQAARNRQRLKMEEARDARQAKEEEYQENTLGTATRIVGECRPIDGTIAQTYLYGRGIPPFETDVLLFHPGLPYPGRGKYPALICRVDDMAGSICAAWRIFLRGDGRKADVEQPKMGIGPAGGGAVRIGGVARKIGLAEGVESALGAWNLIGRKYPVWAALSTSGLVGIELPLGVEHVVIFPDGDASMRKKDGEYVPSVPAGRKAAQALRERLLQEGIGCTIAAEPPAGKDYCDLWNEMAREVA